MSSDTSLINIGELSKPATVLIEKISDAMGCLFKPYQIARVAKAEAEAERIYAESQIQISELQHRAFHRFLNEEVKKQQNMEEIIQKAIPQLDDKSKPEQVENDWITNFFDKCRLISDSDMQNLWSHVLAGEANSPGAYSKRTVNLLSSLDKNDAQLFTNLCTFNWKIMGRVSPLFYNIRKVPSVYIKHRISFASLNHLDSIGLIQFDSLSGYSLSKFPKKINVSYYDLSISLEFQKEADNSLEIGHVLLTQVGQELALICGSQPDVEFKNYILKRWKDLGYIKDEKTE